MVAIMESEEARRLADLRILAEAAEVTLTPRTEALIAQERLTATEAGELLGITRQAIVKKILSGRLPAESARLAGMDVWQIEPREVLLYAFDRLLERQRRAAAARRRAAGEGELLPEPEYLSPELKARRRKILGQEE